MAEAQEIYYTRAAEAWEVGVQSPQQSCRRFLVDSLREKIPLARSQPKSRSASQCLALSMPSAMACNFIL